MLFDWLVVGQIVPYNPAHAVRGPKHVVKKGKTPVLSTEEMHDLFAGFPAGSLVALRDSRATRHHGLHLRPYRRGTATAGRRLLHPGTPRLAAPPRKGRQGE